MSKFENIMTNPEFDKEIRERVRPIADQYAETLFDIMTTYGEDDNNFSVIHGKYVSAWAIEFDEAFDRVIKTMEELGELLEEAEKES